MEPMGRAEHASPKAPGCGPQRPLGIQAGLSHRALESLLTLKLSAWECSPQRPWPQKCGAKISLISSLGLGCLGCHRDGHPELIAGGVTDPCQPACEAVPAAPSPQRPWLSYSGSRDIQPHGGGGARVAAAGGPLSPAMASSGPTA